MPDLWTEKYKFIHRLQGVVNGIDSREKKPRLRKIKLTPEERAERKERRRLAVNASQRRYYQRNREKCLERKRKYDQEHPNYAKNYRLKKKLEKEEEKKRLEKLRKNSGCW